jgi:hypothetical protein
MPHKKTTNIDNIQWMHYAITTALDIGTAKDRYNLRSFVVVAMVKSIRDVIEKVSKL